MTWPWFRVMACSWALFGVAQALLPSAQNPELKAMLEKSTPMFEAHLEHATALQGEQHAAMGTGAKSE